MSLSEVYKTDYFIMQKHQESVHLILTILYSSVRLYYW
jgi:hypothetical protein